MLIEHMIASMAQLYPMNRPSHQQGYHDHLFLFRRYKSVWSNGSRDSDPDYRCLFSIHSLQIPFGNFEKHIK
jgi:hypothetical protein